MRDSKRFIGFGRVSSAEQRAEGFSLQTQEEAMRQYAVAQGGGIASEDMYLVDESASDSNKRRVFHAMLDKVRDNPAAFAGIVFDRIDRATRNPRDFALLVELTVQQGVVIYFVKEGITSAKPEQRMIWNILAASATFEVENKVERILDARKVGILDEGRHLGLAPFGYRNCRKGGKGFIEPDPSEAPTLMRMFDLFANGAPITIEQLADHLAAEGYVYSTARSRFPKNVVLGILRNRIYIGMLKWRGEWVDCGKHTPLVDREVFNRVQVRLSTKRYATHEHVFANGLIRCGVCGKAVTCERKSKQLASGEIATYRFYRCGANTSKTTPHPKPNRIKEEALEEQVVGFFQQLRLDDPDIREGFLRVLRAKTKHQQSEDRDRRGRLTKRLAELQRQLDRLIHLRMADEISAEEFAHLRGELRSKVQSIKLALSREEVAQDQTGEAAVQAFELSQGLVERWDRADAATKRLILETVCLNLTMTGVTLNITARSPFDLLLKEAGGKTGRGDWI